MQQDHEEFSRDLSPATKIVQRMDDLAEKLDVMIKDKSQSIPPSAARVILLSQEEICNLTGLTRQQIHRMTARGEFPKPKVLVGRRIAWPLQDYSAWVEGRPYAA